MTQDRMDLATYIFASSLGAKNTTAVARDTGTCAENIAAVYKDTIVDSYQEVASYLVDHKDFIDIDIAGYSESVMLLPNGSDNPEHGFVYLMTDGSAVKIGKSADLGKRISQIQTGNPNEIILLQAIETDDMARVERSLHEWFKKYRMRGEWFDLLPHFGLDHAGYIHSMLGENTVTHKYSYSIAIKNDYESVNELNVWTGGDAK